MTEPFGGSSEGSARIEMRRIEPLFKLRRIGVTDGAWEALNGVDMMPGDLLRRHMTGDWGNVLPEDAREKEYSVEHGLSVMSSYPVGAEEVWVITERGRSLTTFLLPKEY